jgi:hypothetical protein
MRNAWNLSKSCDMHFLANYFNQTRLVPPKATSPPIIATHDLAAGAGTTSNTGHSGKRPAS